MDWVCPWANREDHIEIQNTTTYFTVSGSTPTDLKEPYRTKVQKEDVTVFLADVGNLDIEQCSEILQGLTSGGDNNGR